MNSKMTSKLQLIFLFGFITLSVQRQVRDDNSNVNPNMEDLEKLIQNLIPQAHKHSDEDQHHNAHAHHNDERANLMNIQTLNMFYKNKDRKRADSDTDVHKLPKQTTGGSGESKEEIVELLNELEKELTKDADDDMTELRCNTMRCRKKKCRGCGRAGMDKTLRCRECAIDRVEREGSELRCRGNACGRSYRVTGKDVDHVGDVSKEKSNNVRSEYRCRGNRCGRSRNDEGNYGINSPQAKSSKKYRINDDLDAIVLDLSDLDGLLNKFNNCEDGKCRENRQEVNSKQNLAVVENVDLNNLIDNVKSNDNVEAIFIDLSQVENSDELANYIKNKFSSHANNNLVTTEDFFNYYTSVKKEVGDVIMSYLKGEVTLKKLSFLPQSLIQKVYNLKSQMQGVVVSDKEIRDEINRIVFQRGETKVLPHKEKNNNIYVPKWLHSSVIYALNNYNLRAQKSLFPLTSKQRLKLKSKSDLWRRTSKADVENLGIPFELNVQGLGQVAP